jgi:uncharacterized membrane protein YbhN (UPF0104 family)
VALRALIGIAVVGVLLAHADIVGLERALREASVPLLVLGTLAFFASLLLSSMRWRAFLRAIDLTMSIPLLVRFYLVGTFFNAFLPTGFGGDAYKAFVLGRGISSIEAPLAASVLDRAAGLAGLAALTLVGALVQVFVGGQTVVTWVSASIACALVGAATVAIRRPSASAISPPAPLPFSVRSRIRTFLLALSAGARHPRALRSGAIWGVVTAGLVVTAHGFLLHAVHLSVPVGALAGIVLLASLTTVIPFSINGLGFREATYVWALRAYGVPSTPALSFAFVVLGVTLLASVVGGFVYAVGGAPLPPYLHDDDGDRGDSEVDPHEHSPERHQPDRS